MSTALAVDMLGDTLQRAGAHKSVPYPGKYQALKMRPQTGLVPLAIEESGTATDEIAIDFDPFYKNRMAQRRDALAKRLRDMHHQMPDQRAAPQTPKQAATVRLINDFRNKAQQRNNANVPPPALARTNSMNRGTLRLVTAQPQPTKAAQTADKLRKLEEMPTQGLKIPARDLQMSPWSLQYARKQRMATMGLNFG